MTDSKSDDSKKPAEDAPERRLPDAPASSVKAEEAAGSGLTKSAIKSVERAATGEAGEPELVGVRRGMWGPSLGSDTSGYGGLVSPILFPGAAERPYGIYFDEIADTLERALVGGTASYAEAVEKVVVDRGEMTIEVRREHLLAVARAMRDHPGLRFEFCAGVSGVHYPDRVGSELHAVYHLVSITHGTRRVRLEVSCPDDDRHIPSIVSVYPGNDWHERETWDMFGIIFDGHPALTRILMPDDWPGHPQRKDYPLGGIPVEYKGATIPAPDERRSYN
jgi:NADH-quinone oxidoreductase subunit C